MNTSFLKSKNPSVKSKMPADLLKSLKAASLLKTLWADLTPVARRDWMSWIESAKQPETRKRRIEQTCSKLLSGKRRPCCYAVVPFQLYKMLDAAPKAKAHWKTISPDARRDFIDWIDSIKEPETRLLRIQKTCILLANKKPCP